MFFSIYIMSFAAVLYTGCCCLICNVVRVCGLLYNYWFKIKKILKSVQFLKNQKDINMTTATPFR